MVLGTGHANMGGEGTLQARVLVDRVWEKQVPKVTQISEQEVPCTGESNVGARGTWYCEASLRGRGTWYCEASVKGRGTAGYE